MFDANNMEGTLTNHHYMERFSTVMIPISVVAMLGFESRSFDDSPPGNLNRSLSGCSNYAKRGMC
jgi:hypothetical protein